MEKRLILVGFKCGLKPPPHKDKVSCLTTEIAHRTNSYGLPHIIENDMQNQITTENEMANDFSKYKNARIRRLTPKECASLQTIPEWYEFKRMDKKGENVIPASDTSVYKALGNGWTVRVIEHFFQYLPKEWRNAEPMNPEWK